MKVKGSLVWLVMMMFTVCMLSGCGGKNDSPAGNDNSPSIAPSTAPVVEEKEKELLVAQSESPYNFCTRYSEDHTYTWSDEDGITIFTGSDGYIPYVLVWRSYNGSVSANQIHYADSAEFQEEYEERLISASKIATTEIGGKTLSYIEYKYMIDTTEITMIRYIDDSPRNGYVMYTAKFITGEGDETMEALEVAIENFRDNKEYYTSGDSPEKNLEIVPNFAKTMEYVTYDDGWVSMEIPKDWEVAAASFNGGAAAYIVHAYDPANRDIQIFIGMGTLWFEDEAAYTKLVKYPLYGKEFEGLPYMISGEDPLAETYQNFNVFVDSKYGQNMNFNYMYDWTKLEELGYTILGGEILRGTYKNEEGKDVEGIFSGKWSGSLKMYGYRYPGAIYSPMFMTAPAEDFNEWQEVLAYCISTLKYSESYVNQYNKEEKTTMKNFEANTRIYNEMTDSITSGWNERQTTYDTIYEKQSDATLGYERVYNTETMEVYRAEIGFTDSYSGTLYQPITEDMYSQPIDGYIYR